MPELSSESREERTASKAAKRAEKENAERIQVERRKRILTHTITKLKNTDKGFQKHVPGDQFRMQPALDGMKKQPYTMSMRDIDNRIRNLKLLKQRENDRYDERISRAELLKAEMLKNS